MQKRIDSGAWFRYYKGMEKTPFVKPADLIEEKEEKVPVSGRIYAKNQAILEAEATKLGVKPAYLYGRILDKYAEWLESKKGR